MVVSILNFVYYNYKNTIVTCNFYRWLKSTAGYIRGLLEKYPTLFFLRKPGGFQWSVLAWGDLEPSYARVNFFPPVKSISWYGKQHLSEVVFSALVVFSLYTKSMHQRVLQVCPLSPTWCCMAQETRVVVNRQLAPPSRQCSSTFLAHYSDFSGEKLEFEGD